MKQYAVPMKLTYLTIVTVEAKNEEHALEKAQAIDLEDDGMSGAALMDWTICGGAKET